MYITVVQTSLALTAHSSSIHAACSSSILLLILVAFYCSLFWHSTAHSSNILLLILVVFYCSF